MELITKNDTNKNNLLKLLIREVIDSQVNAYAERYKSPPHSITLSNDEFAILLSPENIEKVLVDMELISFDTLEVLDVDGDLVLKFDEDELQVGMLSNSKAAKLELDDLSEELFSIVEDEDLVKAINKKFNSLNSELDKIFEIE